MEISKHKLFFRTLYQLKKFPQLVRLDSGLQFTEVAVLMDIHRSETDSKFDFDPKRLQRYLNVSQSAVSQVIASLEDKGYILRNIDVTDRRKFTLSLTEEGRERIVDICRRTDALFDEVFESVTAEEIEQFQVLTSKLLDAVERVTEKQKEKRKF